MNCFSLSFLKDEKNQVLVTNAWLQLVSYLAMTGYKPLNKLLKVNFVPKNICTVAKLGNKKGEVLEYFKDNIN